MQKIFKYPLEVKDDQIVLLPKGAVLLSVQVQHGEPCLWALVETNHEAIPHKIKIYGTGHPVKDVDYMQFLGTFQLYGGDFIGHTFGSVM